MQKHPTTPNPDKRTLYSIGADLVDDGGAPIPKITSEADLADWPKTTDTTFIIPKVKQ